MKAKPTQPRYRVGIVDYGLCNLRSVENAFRFLGTDTLLIDTPQAFEAVDAIVLPGVGAFGLAMENICKQGFDAALDDHVRGRGLPFLGICLGMQLIARESEEWGQHEGLGWIDARVVALEPNSQMRVPHVGWCGVENPDAALFADMPASTKFYFDHSYRLETNTPASISMAATATPYPATIRVGNITAVQFHPEKSQRAGMKLLRNFLETCVAQRVAAE